MQDGAGGVEDSDDDFEAIRKANAAAIAQRQHRERVSAEQKAKALGAKAKQDAKDAKAKSSGSGPGSGSAGGVKSSKKSAGNERSGKAVEAPETGQSKLKGKRNPPPTQADDGGDSNDESDSDSGSDDDEEGLDMTRKADPEDDEFSSDSGSDADEVNVTFDNFDPVEDDFHGIKMFVANLLDGQSFDSSGLVDLVLGQSGQVGTVIKIMDEEEVYGVMTVVSMQGAATQVCLQQIGDFILKKCPASQKEAFARAVRGNTGLIISERMINVPPELAVPLLQGLRSELAKANKDPVSTAPPCFRH